jgi:VWFA-related protein
MTPATRRTVVAATLAACLLTTSARPASQQRPPAEPDAQRPVFRAGAHFVRVDAYPTKDGRLLEGLTRDDFEVFEDGAPQAIETFEFIDYSGFTPEAARRDPNSQRDAFNLAADPRYRVFVLYLDAYHVPLAGSHAIRRPIVDLLNRLLGPRDLFGVLTPAQRPTKDLILGQQTLTVEEQLTKYWHWGQHATSDRTDEEAMIEVCFFREPAVAAELINRRRLDKVFSDLEETILLLSGIREERTNLLLVSRGWQLPDANRGLASKWAPRGPRIGITDAGKLTLGTTRPGDVSEAWCQEELLRVANIDFTYRHRELIARAREGNVTFYPVNPMGLEADATVEGQRDITFRVGRLRELADNTDGIPITMTNDLHEGLRRIAADLSGTYVLGYYTNNTNWNGRMRRITVKLKPAGTSVRARREYRAPTEAEMATIRNPPASSPVVSVADTAFAGLASMRAGAALHVHGRALDGRGEVVVEIAASRMEAGRWKDGGEVQVMVMAADGDIAATTSAKFPPGTRGTIARMPLDGVGPWHAVVRVRGEGEPPEEERVTIRPASGTLLGDPIVFRTAPAASAPLHPAAAPQFRRTERIVVEWPILEALDRVEVRLIGRDGQPLALAPIVSQRMSGDRRVLAVDLNLAPLTAGEYAIEATAESASKLEQRAVALRVGR